MPQKPRLFRQVPHAILPTDPVKKENMMTRNLRSARNQAGLLLLTAGMWLPASAAFAQTVTIDNIETPAGQGFTISVPSVEMTDSNLSEDQVRSLFKGDLSGNAEALANLDAANITIPEIVVTYDIKAPKGDDEESAADDSDAPKSDTESDKADNAANAAEPAAGGKGEIHYKDLVLDNVKGGIAASVSFGSIGMTGDAKSTGHFGKMSMNNLDIGRTLSFYGLVPAGTDTEMKTLYSNFTFEGGTFGSDEFSCNIGTMQLAEVKARPLQHSLLEFMQVAEGLEPEETPDPATMGKLIGFYADFLTAFETTPMHFDGLDCSGETDEDGQVSVKLGGLDVGAFKPGVYPAFTANDIAITAEDGAVSLASFVFKEMDLTEVLKVLEPAPAEPDDAWFEANARKLIPGLAGFSFSGLDGDVPDEDNEGQRIKFKVGDFDLSLADYRNGVPTNISNNASGIVMDVPKDGVDNPLSDLADYGITSIDASYGLKAHWDEAADTIEVENFTLHGENLGTFSLSGTLGNATPDLFSNDLEAAQMAAMGLTVKNVTTNVEDLGIGAIALARAGAEQGKSADEMRQMVAGIAQGSALALLGSNEGSQALSQALNAFLMGTNPAITVTLTSIDPAGLGLADLMELQSDPTQLSSKVKIEAANSGEASAPAVTPPADDGSRQKDKR